VASAEPIPIPVNAPAVLNIPDDAPILFVGDIQGCAADLARLLERAAFDPARHRLLPVGDTINRGPDAAGTLRLLRETRATPIVGNHERALLRLRPEAPLPAWAQKLASAYVQLQAARQWDEAIAWIATWPILARGGASTDPEFLTTVRWCTAEGALPPDGTGKGSDAPAGFAPWHSFYRGSETVMFGHWARQGLYVRDRVRGLDTGCVYGRQLTGLWWPDDRLVQVDALPA
jgi:bis(5'-nucleosyl)-tetraphosphatase (symmetrical)